MQNYYAARKWKRLPQSDCPAYSPVREAKTGIPSVSPAYRGIKMEWLWSERPLIIPVIPLGRRGGVSNDWCINPLFKFMTNETPICFSITSNAKTKNEIQIRFSKWCENEKRKLKFISVFQRDAKTKYEVQNRFSKLVENEKQKAKFKSVFQCHAKTKNVNGIWIPFSHAIEKRLVLRYTHSGYLFYNHSQKLLNVKTCQVSHNDWFITWYLEVNHVQK